MASLHTVTRQLSALDINKKSTRPPSQQRQPSGDATSKLLSKYAAPSIKNAGHTAAPGSRPIGLVKQTSTATLRAGTSRPASPTKKFKPTAPVSRAPSEATIGQSQAQKGLADIGRYDGWLEDETKAGKQVINDEGADELALDSSMAQCVNVPCN
jgi:hypothetical protein